jgi:hypothetical protein
MCYWSQFELKKAKEAQKDESWIEAIHEELHQFTRNDVWSLVPSPSNHNVIEMKWILKNK